MKRDHIVTPRTDVHPHTRNTNNQNGTEVSQFPGHCSQRRPETRAGGMPGNAAGGRGPRRSGSTGLGACAPPGPFQAPSRLAAASGVSANVPCRTGVSPGRTQMSRCDLSKALPVGRCGVFGGGALLGRRAAPVGSEPPGPRAASPRAAMGLVDERLRFGVLSAHFYSPSHVKGEGKPGAQSPIRKRRCPAAPLEALGPGPPPPPAAAPPPRGAVTAVCRCPRRSATASAASSPAGSGPAAHASCGPVPLRTTNLTASPRVPGRVLAPGTSERDRQWRRVFTEEILLDGAFGRAPTP